MRVPEGDTSYNNIVTWGNSNSSIGDNVQLRFEPDGKILFGMHDFGPGYNNGFVVVHGTQNLHTGDWVHVAVTKGGSSIVLYVNGTQAATGTISKTMNVDRMVIGTYYNGGSVYNEFEFTGQIDEVRIWNDVRTVDEIRDNFGATLNGNESGLVAYYTFDQSSGTTLPDCSANAYDGTLTNMADSDWVTSYAMTYVPTATAADAVTSTGFTAQWEEHYSASRYFLDVALDSGFTSFVSGYNGFEISSGATLSHEVSGLSPETDYYYRVRAYNATTGDTSESSNVITVTTDSEPTGLLQ